ncbi:4'-phosphopantetheinyl transferase family protein [Haliangium sp.]|uniref:4'-phosphopantetheinyl transferase family protein n=1 Tax=Haliangium sp. TaxID=2663208 RepID=UPI003D0A2839
MATQLGDAEVQVWTSVPETLMDAGARRRCLALLSEDEQARMNRFRFERDRHLYLVAHALVRRVLSRYVDVAPDRWRFVTNQYGRPDIAPGLSPTPLRFNLSHTRGLVAVAVTLGRDLGVDVEHMFPRSFSLDVAEHFFAPREVAALMALPEHARRDRFFAYWTLKESYIKARGMGLALPLDGFAFHLDRAPEHTDADADADADPVVLGDAAAASVPNELDSHLISLTVEPALADDGRRWWFHQRVVTPEHRLAVAVGRDIGESIRCRIESLSLDGVP